MSLDFDVSKIENYEELTTYETKDGKKIWHPVTSSIIHMCMGIGIGGITKKNWKQFYIRVSMWEKIHGPMLIRGEFEPGDKANNLTPEEIKAHIGLTTNVYPDRTDAQFRKQLFDSFTRDAEWALNKMENANG